MDNIIKLKNVSYKFSDEEDFVLKDINLNIKKGSFTVILGHNGSGKSTLVKLMNGLYKPTSGEVLVNGVSTLNEEKEIEIKRTVGLVFQNPDNQIVSSIVEEDVAFGPENLGIPPKEIRERVDNALKTVGMYEHRFSSPNKLSGGQKQRVAIASILSMLPECIVLDEPTAMLDPTGRREVMSALNALNKEQNITVVLITHFMEEAENADRVIVLNDGKTVMDGVPAEIFAQHGKLSEAGLTIPQTSLLAKKLSKSGINIDIKAISVDACAKEISKIFK